MKNTHPDQAGPYIIRILLLLLAITAFSTAPAPAAINPFPTYSRIKPNVEFWKKVYAEYPSTKGFIHDNMDLSIIYEIIDLRKRDAPGSRKANRRKIKLIKKKYKTILRKLAKGKQPSTVEEERVAKLFSKSRDLKASCRKASENIRFQLCLSDRFREGLIRSGRYLAEIKDIFRKNGLPADLSYLPHVESSYNYRAYSKFGAAGIWQFIRSTGRRFMTISYTLDERRDPIVASRAAARYLKENHNKLGDWPLALTAYNHGANSMLRAKNSLGSYEKIFSEYKNKRFGFASRNFYSEFLAAREVAKNYRKYFRGTELAPPTKTKEIQLTSYLPIANLASYLKVDIQTIQALNPALRKPVFLGQKYVPKGYRLRVPRQKEPQIQISTLPDHLYKKEQKRSRFYRVERGDTAGKIARLHRIKLRDLIDSNQLNRRATIYVGQNLRIPVPGEAPHLARMTTQKPTTATIKQSRKRPAASPEPITIAALTAAPPEIGQATGSQSSPPAPKASTPKTISRTDKAEKLPKNKGQSVHSNISLSKDIVSSAKNIQVASIQPVEQSTVPLKMLPSHLQGVEPETPAIEPPTSNGNIINPAVVVGNFQIERIYTEKSRKIGIVQVEALETLGHYADWLEIPTQQIRLLNGFSYRRKIRTHQEIKIPIATVSKELFEERRYEYHKEIEEDFFSAYQIVGTQTYSIRRGDNIWTLCKGELDMPFWLMKKYNPIIDFDSLKPKQKLIVPIIESAAPPVILGHTYKLQNEKLRVRDENPA